jgi:photosystem II stability/assembly factor-like uncharacterized protein
MVPPSTTTASQPLVWVLQGPHPSTRGQVEGIVDKEVVGAVKAVAVHPSNPDVVYIGAVNGGIWRTDNAMGAQPNWQQLTDAEQSLSIGALEFDPTDGTHRTLVAGTGRFSSLRGMGGRLIGVLRTTNAGANWTTLNPGGLFNRFHICAIASRGAIIVAAANNGGVFRTTDTGVTWTRISGTAATGLPAGITLDLSGDPRNPARLFAHAGTAGIFRSTDIGATWTKVSNAAIDGLLQTSISNVKIAVGSGNNVYVAIATFGQLAGLFRSGNGGNAWTALDLPTTIEAGSVPIGIHPGQQASIHMSLAVDGENPRIVYIGGDRQPGVDEAVAGLPTFPNAIGANDYSGRIFRVDSTRPGGRQATHLTHSNTAGHSAPHADSRDMAIAANGMLIETDDGGIYRRTDPRTNAGDWFSMNGDLATTEFHSAVWDANTHAIIGGAQDTGSPQQMMRSDARWLSVSTGDGGVVAVDATTTPGFSTRYSSYYNLSDLRRQVYDATGSFQHETSVALHVLAGGADVVPQFYTPIELNQVTPIRLIIGAANGVYESDDQGDTVTAIDPNIAVNDPGPIAYGAAGNAELLYVGSGSDIFIRTAAHPAPLVRSATYPATGEVVGIAVPAATPGTAFVIDAARIYRTTNAGAAWTDITNNLPALGVTVLRSVAFSGDLGGGSVIVGTNAGVFAAAAPGFAWSKLGSGLANAPVLRLQYSAPDRVFLAATLGRGAWTLSIPT